MIHRRPRNQLTRSLPLAVLTLLSAFCLLPCAFGQSATATLSGTVEDQNKAVVPGARVKVINLGTGLERETVTNDSGDFTIALLPPSTYTVRVERDGFATVEISNVILNVGDQKALRIELKTGPVTAMVKIEGGALLINESPAIATVVDQRFAENLPLNGRSFQQLITLAPGVVTTKTSGPEQGQFSVNGQRANANYFTVDGVSANIGVSVLLNNISQAGSGSIPGLTTSGGTNGLVSADALQEFRMQTSTYAPEFGRQPGAQVQIITRSGTNQFHGRLFEYFRNDALDANDWFNNANRLRKPATRQNDFGGVLGGPILKNHTFFFFSYEGLRLRVPQSKSLDVPSLAARQSAPAGVKPILDAYPVPNGPNRIGANGQPNGFAVFNTSFSNPSTLNATSLRIDHTVNSKLTLFGRYNIAPSETTERAQAGSFTANTLAQFSLSTQTLTGGATISLSPTLSNELRANYSRNLGKSFFEFDSFGGAAIPADSIVFPTGTSRESALISFFLVGPSNTIFQVGTAADNSQRQVNVVDNLSVGAGAHQLKFGVDYRRLAPIIKPQLYSALIQFNGVGTPGAAQPSGTALSGTTAGIVVSASSGERFPIFHNLSFYGQDIWRLTRRMTLTFGLRWEINPAPTEGKGNDALTVVGLDNPPSATVAPRGTRLYSTTLTNFAPRLGVAYQLFDRPGRETLLRGGFGVFYDLGTGSIANAFAGSDPFTASKTVLNVAFPLSASAAAAPAVTANPSGFLTVFDPNIKLPRTYQWNFSIEQALGANQSLSAAYVAAVGRRLLRQERVLGTGQGGNLNPAAFGPSVQVILTKNTATSDYHAMQLQFQRRLSRRWQALASYTWSHSLDIASNDSFPTNTPSGKIDPLQDRGPSDFDVRHLFTGAISYDLPSPTRQGAIAKAILSDWSIETIFTARSATPVNVSYLRSLPGLGTVTLRPDVVPGIPLYLSDPTAPGGKRFNNTRVTVPGNPNPQFGPFLRPVEARQGTLGRNALRGFPVSQLDFALRRRINLTERISLQLKAEFFNILNHPNFGDPVGTLTSSTFGFSTMMLGRSLGSGSTIGGFNPLYQVGGPRSTQLALKLEF